MISNWNIFDEIKLGLLNLQTEIEFSKPGLFMSSLLSPGRAADDDDDNDQSIESDDNHNTGSRKKIACTSAVNETSSIYDRMPEFPKWDYEDDADFEDDNVKKELPRRGRAAKRPALKRSYSFDYDDDFDDIIDDSVEAFREYQKEVIIKFIEAARNISNSLSDGDEELEDDMVDAWKDLLKRAMRGDKVSNCKSYKLLRGCGVTDDMLGQLLGLSHNAEAVPKNTSEAEVPAKRAPAKRGRNSLDSADKTESRNNFSEFQSFADEEEND